MKGTISVLVVYLLHTCIFQCPKIISRILPKYFYLNIPLVKTVCVYIKGGILIGLYMCIYEYVYGYSFNL